MEGEPESVAGRNEEWEQFLAGCNPPVRELTTRVRELILGLDPDIEESVYQGARMAGYRRAGAPRGIFCTLSPQKSHLNVFLNRGILLDDPAGYLVHAGKHGRFVRISSVEDCQADALKSLLMAAAGLGEQ